MINFLFKCNSKSLHIYIFKTTWKSYFKNNKKISGNLLKNLEKSWKYHGILSVRKSGNPEINNTSNPCLDVFSFFPG